jgi:heme/copper-type cytochrome/quinol oxidase subunit 2
MRKRYSATLLLALPFAVAMVPALASPSRTIEITVSRSVISPEEIEMQVGERVRLNVTSADGAHVFQVKGLRLDARIPAGGGTMTFDLMPTEPGKFEIEGVDDGRPGQSAIRARFIVKK